MPRKYKIHEPRAQVGIVRGRQCKAQETGQDRTVYGDLLGAKKRGLEEFSPDYVGNKYSGDSRVGCCCRNSFQQPERIYGFD